MHDDGPSNKITQPPALLVEHHGGQSHAIKSGKAIYRAHQVARDRLERR